jgi:hypothetical protein
MANHWSKGVTLAALVVILISCASPTLSYRYANVAYDTPEGALAAQRADIDAILSKIPSTDRPVGGSAVIILPSIPYAVKNLVEWRGPEPSPDLKAQAMNHQATMTLNGIRARGEELEKRRLFDRVTITSSDDPERVTLPADVSLYVFKKDGRAQWFLKKQTGTAPVLTAVPEVSAALPPVQREMIWLEHIEKMSRSE